MRRRLMLAALAAILLTSCAAETQAPAGGDASAPSVPAARDNAGSLPTVVAADPTRSLVLTAHVELRSADPWGVGERIRAIALGAGGDLLDLTQSGGEQERAASVTIRVPADRFDEVLAQIRAAAAEVVSSNVNTRDVTDQYVDLQARLSSKRAEEQSYLSLLARAEKVEDILKIDQALASVRTQIEQLSGQLASLKTRIAYATITVRVTSAAFGPNAPSGFDAGRTIAEAFAALRVLIQVLADLVIWLVVLGWLPALLIGGAVFALRTLRRRTAKRP